MDAARVRREDARPAVDQPGVEATSNLMNIVKLITLLLLCALAVAAHVPEIGRYL